MNQYRNHSISIDEYFQIRESSEVMLEYIDGFVYMSPSPSTKHQRISSKLQIKLGNFLEGKSCELFHAPYDIELKSEKIEGQHDMKTDTGEIKSKFLDGFRIDLSYIFNH